VLFNLSFKMSGPSAAAVGNKFVVSYYTYLNQEPQLLQNFYKINSVFTHGSEATFGSPEETVSGLEEINKKIHTLDFRDVKVTLSVVDCQPSHNGGILVLVVGNLSNKGEPSRKFVQTFFLAEQTKGVYFVLNDIFRYLEEPKIAVTENPHMEAKTQTPKQEEPKPKETNVVHSQELTLKPVPSNNENTSSSSSSALKKDTTLPAKKVTSPPPPSPSSSSSNEEKKSWSNVASVTKETINTTTNNNNNNIHNKRHINTSPNPTPNPIPIQNLKSKNEERSPTSLFVSNVPFGANLDQIKSVFNKFGEIKEIQIFTAKGFVFLELSSIEEAQKAIHSAKNNELVLDGRTLNVEERRQKKKRVSIKMFVIINRKMIDIHSLLLHHLEEIIKEDLRMVLNLENNMFVKKMFLQTRSNNLVFFCDF